MVALCGNNRVTKTVPLSCFLSSWQNISSCSFLICKIGVSWERILKRSLFYSYSWLIVWLGRKFQENLLSLWLSKTFFCVCGLLLSNIEDESTISLSYNVCVHLKILFLPPLRIHSFTAMDPLSSFELGFQVLSYSAQRNCFLGDLLPSTFYQLSLEHLLSQSGFSVSTPSFSFILFLPFSCFVFLLPSRQPYHVYPPAKKLSITAS